MSDQGALHETDTVIIGAGAAGLAVGACLQRLGVPFIILEQATQVGAVWRKHYDRLHLHTERRNSQLPFLPISRQLPRYISRDQLVTYLEQYAAHFQLQPHFGQRVMAVQHQFGQWETRTQERCYRSNHVVIATGYTRQPYLPHWAGQEQFPGDILHTSAYQNGKPYQNKEVLVVGFGNSAGEIAIDLCEWGAKTVGMSVHGRVNVIGRDILGISALSLGILMDYLPPQLADALAAPLLKLVIGDLQKYGVPKLPYGPNVQIRRDKRVPLIDIGTVKLIKSGDIRMFGGIQRFEGEEVVFVDGRRQRFDAVILGTGYRPKVNQFLIDAGTLLDPHGTPLSSGIETSSPGLYFCGFYISPTGMLREIGIEARKISQAIAGKS